MSAPSPTLEPYDAVLLLSFGGPSAPEEVMPFLERVTAGKGVPRERLELVAEHYYHRGGVSPITAETEAMRASLAAELTARGHEVPVVVAHRHTAPFVLDALREAHERGWRRLVVVVTSGYPSYSGCRQYREDLAQGWLAARDEGVVIEIDKIAPYAESPAILEVQAHLLADALRTLGTPPETTRILFVTHSIPLVMDELSGPGDGGGHAYTRSHVRVAEATCARASDLLGQDLSGELVFCSRSGPPQQPWLEPDVNDAIEQAAAQGCTGVAVVPIGFVSDHMEVVQDLDTEAAATAQQASVAFVRVPTVGRSPGFAAAITDLLEERAALARGASTEQSLPWPAQCAPGCCPNVRADKPALCGSGA